MKFSIITITYNRGNIIEETINSVLKQTYTDWEMIIVDDGSTDHTDVIISKYIEKYGPKFRYIKKDKIGKPSILRNIAIKNAKGDFISILDSDDLWLETKLEEMYTIFCQKKEVKFIFHNLQHFTTPDHLKPAYYNYKDSFYRNIISDLLKGEILAFPVFTMRQSLIKKIGLADEDIIEGLQEFYLKTAAHYDIYYLNKPLTLMRRHDENLTKNFDIIHSLDALKSYKSLAETNLLTKKQYSIGSSLINYKIAKYYFNANNDKKGLEHLRDIFRNTTIFNKWYLKSKLLQYFN